MTQTLRRFLTRRADYTQKHNAKLGRYGWLRLTPAYSLKIVSEILTGCDDSSEINVLDPFCGTGTTALCAAYYGRSAVTTEINPFLVWLTRAKTDFYSQPLIAEAGEAGQAVLDNVRRGRTPKAPVPPMRNIGRWWNPAALDFLCSLKAAIDAAVPKGAKPHSLLTVAFCRTLIHLSNAAFNHQSMSFKSAPQAIPGFDDEPRDLFRKNLSFVLAGAARNPTGQTNVVRADSRRLSKKDTGLVNRVITSPPYVNRMSYIRELRPYMYWLGYLTNGRDAGEMDWEAIGGTWGIATSRLGEWSASPDGFQSLLLRSAAERIAHDRNKNGSILAKYVLRYFDDMWRHFQSLVPTLGNGARLHYIVGNSTFYNVLVPVERLYAEMLARLGFTGVECAPIRKRNSKKELIEFDVRARWR